MFSAKSRLVGPCAWLCWRRRISPMQPRTARQSSFLSAIVGLRFATLAAVSALDRSNGIGRPAMPFRDPPPQLNNRNRFERPRVYIPPRNNYVPPKTNYPRRSTIAPAIRYGAPNAIGPTIPAPISTPLFIMGSRRAAHLLLSRRHLRPASARSTSMCHVQRLSRK